MYTIRPKHEYLADDGHVDLSFRRPDSWEDLPYPNVEGAKMSTLLLGDGDAGPLVALAWFPPMAGELKRGTAHGHDSDNWRITLLGVSHMGPATYGPGEFRFQAGGKPYGADDYATGPLGGYHLVMFGDRSGFPIRPVKKELEPVIAPQTEQAATALGITIADPYPAHARGLVTTLGVPDKAGKIEGSFRDAGSWPELVAGVRFAAGLFGERTLGPILLLLHCDPGVTAFPACTFATELLHMVVDGSCAIGADRLQLGDVRLQEAGAASPAIVAGDDGLSLFALVADRRHALPPALATSSAEARAWGDTLTQLVDGLVDQLGLAPAEQ